MTSKLIIELFGDVRSRRTSNKSAAANLGRSLSGRWTYNGSGGWNCDDGTRVVKRCCAGYDGFEDQGGFVECWLYETGKVPVRAEIFLEGAARKNKEESHG